MVEKTNSFIKRVKRAYLCQTKRLCTRLLNRCNPRSFYKYPKTVTYLWYLSQKGYFPKLHNPRDFNEKLFALNLEAFLNESKRADRIICADKYQVREFVSGKGFQSILNDCYGVFNSFDAIDFQSLPDQFVVKLTNGSGQNFICRNKSELDLNHLRSLIEEWLSGAPTFGLKSGEWHYSAIKPRIIIEKYLPSLDGSVSLVDYKFLCIHGKAVGTLVCYDRKPESHQVQLDLYDLHWHRTDGIIPSFHNNQRAIPCPQCLVEMRSIAEDLSAAFDFVRVDFYELGGHPVFGEMTFTPAGNIMSYFRQWVLDNMLKVFNGEIEASECLKC